MRETNNSSYLAKSYHNGEHNAACLISGLQKRTQNTRQEAQISCQSKTMILIFRVEEEEEANEAIIHREREKAQKRKDTG